MKRLIPIVLALLLALSGCAALLDREYLVVEPHVEKKSPEFDPADLTVNSRESLKSAFLLLVQNHIESSVIRVANYSGEIERDLPEVRIEVSEEEPIGAFAINYMSYSVSRVLTQYTVTVNISYRYTAEQIAAIKPVSYVTGLSEELLDVLRSRRPSLTVEMNYYDPQLHDVEKLLSSQYYQNPQWAMGMPEISIKTYPETGLRRIIDVEFSFPGTDSELLSRERMSEVAMLELAERLPADALPPVAALLLHDYLNEHIEPYTGAGGVSSVSTLYGAAAARLADSEGYALAYKRACDIVGIECRILAGHKNGDAYFWNAVNLGGNWYHVDLYANDLESGHEMFLKDDLAMEEAAYRWDKNSAPVCDLGPLSYERIFAEINPEDTPPDDPDGYGSHEEDTPPDDHGGGLREEPPVTDTPEAAPDEQEISD